MPSKYFAKGSIETAFMLFKPNYFGHPTPQLLVEGTSYKRFDDLSGGFNFNYKKGSRFDAGYLLLSFSDPDSGKPKIEIWDLNNQKKVHSYKIDENYLDEIHKKYGKFGQHTQLFNPVLLEDGSIVTISNHGAIIKIDKCGKILNYRNDLEYHHSVAKDNNGNIYAPLVLENESYFKSLVGYSNKDKFRSEGFAVLDKNLNLKKTYSLKEIFTKAGLLKDALDNRKYDSDPFHLNDVDPLLVGKDQNTIVFLSMRHYGIMGYDLSNENLLWVVKSLSHLQHDVTPLNQNGSSVSVFDNGSEYNTHSGEKFQNTMLIIKNLPITQKNSSPSFFVGSNLIGSNLGDKEISYERYIFNDFSEKKIPRTNTQGRGEYFNNGLNLFVEETNYGRIFEIDLKNKAILWEFINRNDETRNHTMVGWSRKIDKLPNDKLLVNLKKCQI